MQEKKKSAVVAGLLGMILGIFGGHDWYLGKTKQAITHVCVTVIGAIVAVIGAILLNISEEGSWLMMVADVLIIGAYVVLATNFIWGFIVGMVILMRGNVGLAAAGYATNNDTMMQPAPVAAAEPTAPVSAAEPIAPAASVNTIETASTEVNNPATPSVAESVVTAVPTAPVAPDVAPAAPVAPAVPTTALPEASVTTPTLPASTAPVNAPAAATETTKTETSANAVAASGNNEGN